MGLFEKIAETDYSNVHYVHRHDQERFLDTVPLVIKSTIGDMDEVIRSQLCRSDLFTPIEPNVHFDVEHGEFVVAGEDLSRSEVLQRLSVYDRALMRKNVELHGFDLDYICEDPDDPEEVLDWSRRYRSLYPSEDLASKEVFALGEYEPNRYKFQSLEPEVVYIYGEGENDPRQVYDSSFEKLAFGEPPDDSCVFIPGKSQDHTMVNAVDDEVVEELVSRGCTVLYETSLPLTSEYLSNCITYVTKVYPHDMHVIIELNSLDGGFFDFSDVMKDILESNRKRNEMVSLKEVPPKPIFLSDSGAEILFRKCSRNPYRRKVHKCRPGNRKHLMFTAKKDKMAGLSYSKRCKVKKKPMEYVSYYPVYDFGFPVILQDIVCTTKNVEWFFASVFHRIKEAQKTIEWDDEIGWYADE